MMIGVMLNVDEAQRAGSCCPRTNPTPHAVGIMRALALYRKIGM